MNIFVTSENPVKCAEYLDNKRLVKMVLETAQLLSTSINLMGGQGPYKTTHANHPCAKWARQTRGNYMWLWRHFDALCFEYKHRFGKSHACHTHRYALMMKANYIPHGERTPFVNCAANAKLGISYKHLEDVPVAYQMYLSDRWELDKRPPTWEIRA